MYSNYFVIFNGNTSKDLKISVVKRPSAPSPIRQYRETEVIGRNGKLYEDLGTYGDIEISVEFNFIEYDPNNFNERLRQVKKWINNVTDSKLKFSDDLSYFFVVSKTVISDSSRTFKKLGRFTVTFTCEPFMYLEDGQEERTLSNSLNNNYEVTQPIYKISGEGMLTLTVNGASVIANVGQNLTIDTKLGLCFRADGTINNTALTGKYKDLFLKEGNNAFSYTAGFTINIIPNWRCL
jgi:predicted phage tail component-like protein